MKTIIRLIFCAAFSQFINAWSYTNHGSDWNQDSCLSGGVQSPIKLSVSGLTAYNMKAKLSLNYQDLFNVYLYRTADKQQMFINLTSHDGNVTYVDQYGNEYFYGLENIFFRYKAEHYLEGLQNTLEMQLIHRSQTDKTQMLGVSVFFDSGMDFDNDFMQELDPRLTNVGQPRKRISLASKLFDDFYGNFFYYNGSMTVPPCTEKVQWFIYNVPIQISAFYNTQLFALIGDASYGGNYRAPQNQTGRTVQLVSKIYWDQYKLRLINIHIIQYMQFQVQVYETLQQ